MRSNRFTTLVRIALAILCVNISGCVTPIGQVITSTASTDTPLSDFILGEWLSADVKSNVSNESLNVQYGIVFETYEQVKFIVIYPDNDTEGYMFKYYFTSQDAIYIENMRTTGGEVWLLEKSGSNLIITRNFGNSSTRIVLERIK
jgi:hypothetical protein